MQPTVQVDRYRTYEMIEDFKIQQVEAVLDGWRWLEIGEDVLAGDYIHDPASVPKMVTSGTWVMTPNSHPVRTKRIGR